MGKANKIAWTVDLVAPSQLRMKSCQIYFESNHLIGIDYIDVAFEQDTNEGYLYRVWKGRIHWILFFFIFDCVFYDSATIFPYGSHPSRDGRDTKSAARKYIPPPTRKTPTLDLRSSTAAALLTYYYEAEPFGQC